MHHSRVSMSALLLSLALISAQISIIATMSFTVGHPVDFLGAPIAYIATASSSELPKLVSTCNVSVVLVYEPWDSITPKIFSLLGSLRLPVLDSEGDGLSFRVLQPTNFGTNIECRAAHNDNAGHNRPKAPDLDTGGCGGSARLRPSSSAPNAAQSFSAGLRGPLRPAQCPRDRPFPTSHLTVDASTASFGLCILGYPHAHYSAGFVEHLLPRLQVLTTRHPLTSPVTNHPALQLRSEHWIHIEADVLAAATATMSVEILNRIIAALLSTGKHPLHAVPIASVPIAAKLPSPAPPLAVSPSVNTLRRFIRWFDGMLLCLLVREPERGPGRNGKKGTALAGACGSLLSQAAAFNVATRGFPLVALYAVSVPVGTLASSGRPIRVTPEASTDSTQPQNHGALCILHWLDGAEGNSEVSLAALPEWYSPQPFPCSRPPSEVLFAIRRTNGAERYRSVSLTGALQAKDSGFAVHLALRSMSPAVSLFTVSRFRAMLCDDSKRQVVLIVPPIASLPAYESRSNTSSMAEHSSLIDELSGTQCHSESHDTCTEPTQPRPPLEPPDPNVWSFWSLNPWQWDGPEYAYLQHLQRSSRDGALHALAVNATFGPLARFPRTTCLQNESFDSNTGKCSEDDELLVDLYRKDWMDIVLRAAHLYQSSHHPFVPETFVMDPWAAAGTSTWMVLDRVHHKDFLTSVGVPNHPSFSAVPSGRVPHCDLRGANATAEMLDFTAEIQRRTAGVMEKSREPLFVTLYKSRGASALSPTGLCYPISPTPSATLDSFGLGWAADVGKIDGIPRPRTVPLIASVSLSKHALGGEEFKSELQLFSSHLCHEDGVLVDLERTVPRATTLWVVTSSSCGHCTLVLASLAQLRKALARVRPPVVLRVVDDGAQSWRDGSSELSESWAGVALGATGPRDFMSSMADGRKGPSGPRDFMSSMADGRKGPLRAVRNAVPLRRCPPAVDALVQGYPEFVLTARGSAIRYEGESLKPDRVANWVQMEMFPFLAQ